MTLAQRLKDLRSEKGLSQSALADILGRTQQAIGKWEVGKSEPDGATLLKLSAFFNVTTDYLLGKSDNPHGAPAQPTTSAPSYYNDPEVAQMANEIKDNPDMRILFDASRDPDVIRNDHVRQIRMPARLSQLADFRRQRAPHDDLLTAPVQHARKRRPPCTRAQYANPVCSVLLHSSFTPFCLPSIAVEKASRIPRQHLLFR